MNTITMKVNELIKQGLDDGYNYMIMYGKPTITHTIIDETDEIEFNVSIDYDYKEYLVEEDLIDNTTIYDLEMLRSAGIVDVKQIIEK